MKFVRLSVYVVTLLLAITGGVFMGKNGITSLGGTSYIKTSEPLFLASEGDFRSYHVLPMGTAMYFDKSFPEGHSRYIVYVNIKGTPVHEEVRTDKVNLIDPIWAYPIEADDVKKLLAEVPVSRDELVSILKARKMTREELVQILRDWKE